MVLLNFQGFLNINIKNHRIFKGQVAQVSERFFSFYITVVLRSNLLLLECCKILSQL